MDFEQVATAYAPQSRLLRSWSLPGGISAHMTALEIMLPDGITTKLVVRQPGKWAFEQNPNAAADEFRVLQVIQPLGAPVPATYFADQAYFVMEFVDGKAEYAPANVDDFLEQSAAALARIHAVDISGLASVLGQPKTFSQRVTGWLSDAGPLADPVRPFLESVMTLPSLNRPVLLHGDYWPGNLLWRDGRLVAVVDWENAQLGDPLADLAISRLDILFMFGLDAMYSFTQHYQTLAVVDLTQLPYWDLSSAMRAAPYLARWSTVYAPLGRPDVTEHTMRECVDIFIEQAIQKLATS